MVTQKYRSESDLVIWLLFGFEEVIVQVTDRECPLAHTVNVLYFAGTNFRGFVKMD